MLQISMKKCIRQKAHDGKRIRFNIRSFIGGMRDYNKGILVSTSGFSKDAIHEAERANIAIILVYLNRLVELFA